MTLSLHKQHEYALAKNHEVVPQFQMPRYVLQSNQSDSGLRLILSRWNQLLVPPRLLEVVHVGSLRLTEYYGLHQRIPKGENVEVILLYVV